MNFENFAILMLMISAAVFAVLGVFKIRRARIASFLSGTCFYALLACYLISSFFDPMEQGRNGGAMPFISMCLGPGSHSNNGFMACVEKQTQDLIIACFFI